MFVRLCHQTFHRLGVSELRINFCIIFCIVFMVGVCLHNRIQINSGNAKFFQIRKFLTDSFQVSAVTLFVFDFSLIFPRKNSLPVVSRRPVAETVRENLIPDRIIYPVRRPVHISRIHPWNRKALKHPAFHLHLLFCQKSVFKIIPDLIICVQFKIILAALVFRYESRSPPDLMFQPFFVDNLFPDSGPLFVSSKNSRFKGISIIEEHPLHIISCLQIDNQFRFI